MCTMEHLAGKRAEREQKQRKMRVNIDLHLQLNIHVRYHNLKEDCVSMFVFTTFLMLPSRGQNKSAPEITFFV